MPKQNKKPGIHLYKSIPTISEAQMGIKTEWHWILIDKNGKTIARSKTHKRKSGAVDSIRIAAKLFIGSMGLSGGHYFNHTGKEMKVDCFI